VKKGVKHMGLKVFIVGIDGYIGWSLALALSNKGHKVRGVDNGGRRKWVKEMGSDSLLPIESRENRHLLFYNRYKGIMYDDNIINYHAISEIFKSFHPDVIVHLGEMPSAPYSMIDNAKSVYTHNNNVIGTLNVLYAMKEHCPDAHLVKLGTMGEYGTPNISITEGPIEIEHHGRKDLLPFPKRANSWYHLTKVHDSNNIEFACRTWDLKSTDIMQGIVYGTKTPDMEDDETLNTRFDYDQCFGTIINRFCTQAIARQPITLYGKGGQQRGFLPLKDSIQCLTLAIENAPDKGEYRVFNQFEEVYTIKDLATLVWSVAQEMGYDSLITNIPNPRTESEDHFFQPEHEKLLKLGYKPTTNMRVEITKMLKDIEPYKKNIRKEVLMPDIQWRS
jgi:UDP-sulfoquinovose synthase